MTAPEPRPPAILGEYGEGYCRYCHFVEALDQHGLLLEHRRGIGNVAKDRCKGSGKKPPRLTPVTSKLAAFRTTMETALCSYCDQYQSVMTYTSGPIFARHWQAGIQSVLCEGTGRTAPASQRARNHAGDRGDPPALVDLERH